MTHLNYNVPTLAISNEKGGVGKTFLTASLAEWAARFLDLNVLVVDTDIQCNLTALMVGLELMPVNHLGVDFKVPPIHPDFYQKDPSQIERPSIAGAFLNEVVMPYPTWIGNKSDTAGRVEILPAHGEKLEKVVSKTQTTDNLDDPLLNALYRVAQSEVVAEHYDLVIFDTNPTRNILSRSVLRAATHLVIPMEFDVHSIDGILSMQSSLKAENHFRNLSSSQSLELIGLLPNRFVAGSRRSAGLSKLHYDEIKDIWDNLFLSQHSFIPQAEVVKKILSGKHRTSESLFDLTSKSKSEFRLRLALEHACVEILRALLKGRIDKLDRIDQHEQRIRQAQKKIIN